MKGAGVTLTFQESFTTVLEFASRFPNPMLTFDIVDVGSDHHANANHESTIDSRVHTNSRYSDSFVPK
jgi:hypothetical protein